MKTLLTGGHLTPALAMIDYILANHPRDQIFFAGRYYSQEKLKQKAVEKQEIELRRQRCPQPQRLQFAYFSAPKLDSQSVFSWLVLPFKLISSCWQANRLLQAAKPDVFLSFGGYLALPMAIVCKLRGLPILTHEETMVLGMANRLIAKLADRVAFSFSQTLKLLKNSSKAVVTGNPVRKSLLNQAAKKPSWLPEKINQPILLIMGGNQGSLFFNTFVKQNLAKLARKYVIVHQCGRDNQQNHYYDELAQAAQQQLGPNQQIYFPSRWLADEDLAWIYRQAAFALIRAGANTMFELMAVNLPMLLVPLPMAHFGEQAMNAAWLVEQGGGLVIEQAVFNLEQFQTAAKLLMTNQSKFRQNLAKLNINLDAEEQIYHLLLSLYDKKNQL